jgi:AraC-like DNA-binding protein
MQYNGKSDELLQIKIITKKNCEVLKELVPNAMTIIWFEKDDNILAIDNIEYSFNKNQIVCLTEFHQVEIISLNSAKMIRFNRAFYCIIDHDNEVSCKGILFFGASQLPSFSIPDSELKVFQTVYDMFELELLTQDNLQLEMIQMMLKRFLILCARVYKTQNQYNVLNNQQIDIVREYNFLVEQHFKTIHSVAGFAEMLHKSPKTLSNLFGKLSSKTPLQFIQERKMLEARRLLKYSDKSIKEIAFEIGFEDTQTFGRFFKNIEQKSPSQYREIN